MFHAKLVQQIYPWGTIWVLSKTDWPAVVDVCQRQFHGLPFRLNAPDFSLSEMYDIVDIWNISAHIVHVYESKYKVIWKPMYEHKAQEHKITSVIQSCCLCNYAFILYPSKGDWRKNCEHFFVSANFFY